MAEQEILIISNYFPPETGAASNRIYSLARKLSEHNYKVKVVCPLPNYPEGKIYPKYKGSFFKREFFGNIVVNRLFIYASNSSNKFLRLFSSLSFGLVLLKFILFNRLPKKVIIQCSPLIVGFFAVLGCSLKNRRIILNVSDLWPLAGLEMGILNHGFYYKLLLAIEVYIYKKSEIIIGQSNEILKHIATRVSDKKKTLFLYRNFPEFEVEVLENRKSKCFKIVYAGLLGLAQGIEHICTNIEFGENIEFHIYGDGPMADEIKNISKERRGIYYHGSVERDKLHLRLQEYDVTLIPLKNRIYGSVPSKIFEYSKLGLPILYFSDGEGADLITDLNLGVAIREVNYEKLQNILNRLSQGELVLPARSEILKTSLKEFNLETQFINFKKNILSA